MRDQITNFRNLISDIFVSASCIFEFWNFSFLNRISQPEKSLENKFQQKIIVGLDLEWKKHRISYISWQKIKLSSISKTIWRKILKKFLKISYGVLSTKKNSHTQKKYLIKWKKLFVSNTFFDVKKCFV